MRLTLLTHFPGRGGSTSLLAQLRDFFLLRGHEVTVLAGADDPHPVLKNYQVVPAAKPWRARLAAYLQAIEQTRPDVVYSISGRDEMDVLRFLKCPRVRHVSSLEQHRYVDMFHWLRQMDGSLEGVTANTPDVLEIIRRHQSAPCVYALAPYRLNDLFLSQPDIEPAKTASGPVQVAFVARLEAFQKRADWLPEVAQRCRAAGRELEWHIYGAGELEADLRQRLPAAAGAERAIFHGWADAAAMARRLAGHDLFFLCSRWEGLPIAMVEAMLCGEACVAPDLPGGMGYVLQQGGGWLYDAGSPRAAAEALSAAAADRAQIAARRVEAQRIARRLFAPKLVEEQLLALENMLAGLRFNGRGQSLAGAGRFWPVTLPTYARRKAEDLARRVFK